MDILKHGHILLILTNRQILITHLLTHNGIFFLVHHFLQSLILLQPHSLLSQQLMELLIFMHHMILPQQRLMLGQTQSSQKQQPHLLLVSTCFRDIIGIKLP
jgi:hypothetical protein